MENGTTTLEKRLPFSLEPGHFAGRYLHKRQKKKHMTTQRTVYKCPALHVLIKTYLNPNVRTDKQTVVYLCNEIIFNNKKEGTCKIHCNMDESQNDCNG